MNRRNGLVRGALSNETSLSIVFESVRRKEVGDERREVGVYRFLYRRKRPKRGHASRRPETAQGTLSSPDRFIYTPIKSRRTRKLERSASAKSLSLPN